MQDFFNLPSKYHNHVSAFEAASGVQYYGIQAWSKPRGVSMCMLIAIGGGGGGGGGFTRTAGSAGGGGGSGASSGIARLLIPAIFLPDVLHIQVGAGGKGGAAGAAGGSGLNSFISTSKVGGSIPVLPNIVLSSGVTQPGGGGGGTGAAAGTAGTVPTIAVTQPIHSFGQWFALVGLVGIIGGIQTGAAGTGPTAWGAQMMSPGGSGAGCTTTDYAGGPVTTVAAIVDMGDVYVPSGSTALVAGGVSPGGNGNAGFSKMAPFFQTGGSGGASNNSGVAGVGGNGGIGSGGGGGGAGATGGRGGDGGNGMVWIISW